ncbi:DUF6261 family protein [Carboxylicivirga marina]|uniref:Uncharacterized protein n=1 Tax=Carboxylicivirga marina TaxID=2800988 RepID=A0ABS1HGE3_9BACT|nr:DUF6261 family protein [Carboxylicivirga marina]MBK3516637.1 hypothetical protein [Carboxylicivirga marina]
MKINKINRNIRVTDAADLAGKLHGELDKSTLEDVHVSTLRSEMSTISIGLSGAINESKAMSALEDHDERRDMTYRSLLHIIKGFLLHPDATIREAAVHVDMVLDNYGFDLINQNYSSESSLLDALIRDLEEPETAAMVAVLPGMVAIVEQLKTEQKQFKAAEADWHEARAEDGKTESASALKHELLKVVNNKLLVYLKAMQQMNPAPYQELINDVVMHIERANALVKRRRNSEETVEVDN